MAFGLPGREDGSVVILPVADPLPSRVSIDDRVPGRVEIIGVEKASELVRGWWRWTSTATAGGRSWRARRALLRGARRVSDPGPDGGAPRRLGLPRPARGESFAPQKSELRGGGRLRVSGEGSTPRPRSSSAMSRWRWWRGPTRGTSLPASRRGPGRHLSRCASCEGHRPSSSRTRSPTPRALSRRASIWPTSATEGVRSWIPTPSRTPCSTGGSPRTRCASGEAMTSRATGSRTSFSPTTRHLPRTPTSSAWDHLSPPRVGEPAPGAEDRRYRGQGHRHRERGSLRLRRQGELPLRVARRRHDRRRSERAGDRRGHLAGVYLIFGHNAPPGAATVQGWQCDKAIIVEILKRSSQV